MLRNKRQEAVSKRSEFAEIGMKAALNAAKYRSFDPDNNGSIDPVDIIKAFAQVTKGDGTPWVPFEKAHAIAYVTTYHAINYSFTPAVSHRKMIIMTVTPTRTLPPACTGTGVTAFPARIQTGT